MNDELGPFSPSLTRRAILLAMASTALAGCATSARMASLPSAEFPGGRYDDLPPPPRPSAPPPVSQAPPVATPEPPSGGVIPRSRWARSGPDLTSINPMLPVRYITVHHEGWEPFTATDFAETAARIELVRVGHRNAKNGGYADIGYHFIVDREGRVWEGRSLKYQGAHVKSHNEGNIGVMCLGNFEEQTPTSRQLAALNRHVQTLMAQYRVPVRRVRTHREWEGAHTLCPGRTLQVYVDRTRPGGFA